VIPEEAAVDGELMETIGVDLGGTKMLVGVVDSERRVVYRSTAPSHGLRQDELLETLERELRAAREARPDLIAAGLGIPCTIDRRRGVAIMAVNLELADVPVRELMTERLGLPVLVDNDANVAILAEHRFGAARGARNAVMLTIGTGIGGGLIIDGRLYRGSTGAAAELGHTVIDADGPRYRQAVEPRSASLCIFEYIYFARPDSEMQGQGLHEVRGRMGEQLALEAPVEADVVIPVPDSGTPAAIGYARASGIPFGEGLVKNRYVGRTFIQPDQGLRERGVKLKFNVLPSMLRGKRVVVVDDSIVRGSTTRKLVQMLFEAGATEVHLRVSSPPIISPCFYGIDMADQNELIASGRTIEQVRERLGATSLAYLSLDGLQASTTQPSERFCRACLTGEYPTEIPSDMRNAKLRFEELAAAEAAAAR